MINWKRALRYKKLDHLKETLPAFFKANGGYLMPLHDYCDKSDLELIRAVKDWINYNGGTAERQRKFLTHAVIEGKNVFIRVKPKFKKLTNHQEDERLRIIKAGGIYYVAMDMITFIDWFNKIVIRLKEQAAVN